MERAMRKLLILAIALSSMSLMAQSKKELKSENQKLVEMIESLRLENQELKKEVISSDAILNSNYNTVEGSDLIIRDGMYIERNQVDANDQSHKEYFLNKVKTNSEYRGRILNTFGFTKDAKVIAISLKECKANDYSEFTRSDAVRSITCSAVVIAREKEQATMVDNSERDDTKDPTYIKSVDERELEYSSSNKVSIQ